MGIGKRIQLELEKRGRSVRSLHRTLHQRGVRGSGYSSMWRYLTEKSDPPLELVRAIGEELGVLEEYLVSGEGPRTAAEATAQSQEEVLAAGKRLRQDDPIAAFLTPPFSDQALPSAVQPRHPYEPEFRVSIYRVFLNAMISDVAPDSSRTGGPDFDPQLLFGGLYALVDTPLRIFRSGATEELSRERYAQFVRAMLAALHLALPDQGTGNPARIFHAIEEFGRSQLREEETDG